MEADINITEASNIKTRDELKKYFETGDRPTETQFAELIDSYAHLNEFNFGLTIKPSGNTSSKYYDFYIANDARNSGAGHKIVEGSEQTGPQEIEGYWHTLSRNVFYKNVEIQLIGAIDIEKHQPKIIIERYKQRKKLPSGFVRPAGFYKERMLDAEKWNRKSEYFVKASKIELDIDPIHYFRPDADFKRFMPSGSLRRQGSFKYSVHEKTFIPLQFSLEININGTTYRSKPVGTKMILGSSGESDAINFIFN